VMIVKAMMIAVRVALLDPRPSDSNSGSSRLAKAGSPSRPRPGLASVMPSWQAAR
jgi:hypothetical protein